MLTAKNITCKIGSKILLDDVSLTFEAGKLNLIIGPNGAGKSTFIKVISKQMGHDGHGSVLYGEKNIRTTSNAELASIRSVLSQNIDLAFPLTVNEVVMMGRYPHFTGKPRERDHYACEQAMVFFDIPDLAGRNYMTLSGGEKQRVQFARVVAQIWYPVSGSSRYLILDEPLTFLDVHYQYNFMNKIRELLTSEDLVVIGVVHDLNLASGFADHIVLLNKGKVLADGDKHKVLTSENIEKAYHMVPVIHFVNNERFLFFK